jgi:hypothetical protein
MDLYAHSKATALLKRFDSDSGGDHDNDTGDAAAHFFLDAFEVILAWNGFADMPAATTAQTLSEFDALDFAALDEGDAARWRLMRAVCVVAHGDRVRADAATDAAFASTDNDGGDDGSSGGEGSNGTPLSADTDARLAEARAAAIVDLESVGADKRLAKLSTAKQSGVVAFAHAARAFIAFDGGDFDDAALYCKLCNVHLTGFHLYRMLSFRVHALSQKVRKVKRAASATDQ